MRKATKRRSYEATKRTAEERAPLVRLTKLGLFFEIQERNTLFTGHDVSEVILTAWHSYEQSKRRMQAAQLRGFEASELE
jgi:hypothetical protein